MTGTSRNRPKSGGLLIQERDLTVLRELWKMRVADRDQLKVACGFNSVTRVNTRLLDLVHAGLVRRFFIGSGAGKKSLYSLSLKGAQLIDVQPRGPRRKQNEVLVADFSVLHQLAINDVYCMFRFRQFANSQVRFVNWRGFTETINDAGNLIPDGYVELATSSGIRVAFLEVDLGHERLAIWREKAERYLDLAVSGEFQRKFRHERFRVLVLANSERRIQTIRAMVAKVTEKLFWFAPLDVIRTGKVLAPVWQRPTGSTLKLIFEQTQ